jgi:hypothetical protein
MRASFDWSFSFKCEFVICCWLFLFSARLRWVLASNIEGQIVVRARGTTAMQSFTSNGLLESNFHPRRLQPIWTRST